MFSFNHMGNHGHLGNQMFQYALLLGLRQKHNRDIVIAPNEVFGKYYYTTLRSNLDEAFNITCRRGITQFPTFKERMHNFDADFFNNPPKEDLNILGFFQTEKYFANAADEVRSEFTFKSEISDAAKALRDSFDGETISLHVRRTDYVGNAIHDVVDQNYYAEALSQLPEDKTVLIFTDDPEWAKSEELFAPDRFMVSETDNAYIDLCLMSLCDYHVIANSSFSWWGAWLANSKKVVAPSVWFGKDCKHNIEDVHPEGWIKL